MRVDAHQHFWRLDRGDYRWLTPELGAIHRDFEPRDLEPLLARCGIARTIAVQAADSLAESRFLLDLAREKKFIAGVVGWIDMENRRAAEELDELARRGPLVGIRPMIQDIADETWMLRAALAPAFRALVERELVFDALVRPQHLTPLLELLRRNDDLHVVIDHAGKPHSPARGEMWSGFESWRSTMQALARDTSASVKLSGLATEASRDWRGDDLRRVVDALLEEFGPSRVLWGSDWPVVNLAGGYERWFDATLALLGGTRESEREAILGGNAARVYRLRGEARA